MITAILEYRLPAPATAADMLAKFRLAEPMFRGLAGLHRKTFCYDAETGEGASVYAWTDREAAERCYSPGFFNAFEQIFGTRPTLRYLPALMVIDNLADEVIYAGVPPA